MCIMAYLHTCVYIWFHLHCDVPGTNYHTPAGECLFNQTMPFQPNYTFSTKLCLSIARWQPLMLQNSKWQICGSNKSTELRKIKHICGQLDDGKTSCNLIRRPQNNPGSRRSLVPSGFSMTSLLSLSNSVTILTSSLVPRPPLFLPSVCVHNNTREQKTGKKRGRPGSIHHVSGREVDVGGEGPIFKTKLEREFLAGQDKQFPSC